MSFDEQRTHGEKEDESIDSAHERRAWFISLCDHEGGIHRAFTALMNQVTRLDRTHELAEEDLVYHIVSEISKEESCPFSYSGTFNDESGDVPDQAQHWLVMKRRKELQSQYQQELLNHGIKIRSIVDEGCTLVVERDLPATRAGINPCNLVPCSTEIAEDTSHTYYITLQMRSSYSWAIAAQYCLRCAENVFARSDACLSLIQSGNTSQTTQDGKTMSRNDSIHDLEAPSINTGECSYPPTNFQRFAPIIQLGTTLNARDASIVTLWKSSSLLQIGEQVKNAIHKDLCEQYEAASQISVDECYGRDLSEVLKLACTEQEK